MVGSLQKRRQIGVIISSLEESCQRKVWDGIKKYAAEMDIDVIAYIATFQQRTGYIEEHYRVVFDAVIKNNMLDGCIIFSGFIAEDVGTAAFEEYLKQLSSIPLVSIAASYPGIPSLMVENTNGMESVVSHLIKDHHARRIVFIKGPEGHEEAEARFEGYKAALANNSIPFEESLVVTGGGNFSIEDGVEAVKRLLYEDRGPFDAIVAPDDDTASGVIQELQHQGFSIPSDVAVVGFDDADIASLTTPSLTTVKQPFREIGYNAMDVLISKISGEEVRDLYIVEPTLVCRQSCGCTATAFSGKNLFPSQFKDLKSYVKASAGEIFSSSYFTKLPWHEWVDELIAHVTHSDVEPLKFLSHFDQILINTIQGGAPVTAWRHFLFVLISALQEFNSLEKGTIPLVLTTLHRADWLIEDIRERDRKIHWAKKDEVRWLVQGHAQNIMSAFTARELLNCLEEVSKSLHISTIYLYQYAKTVSYDGWSDFPRLLCMGAIDDDGVRCHPEDNMEMDMEALSRTVFKHKDRKTLLYLPLFFKKEQTGILILENAIGIPIETYETLRIAIATALKGNLLLKDMERISITDELTGLYNRRGFLTLSFSHLSRLKRTSSYGAIFFIDLDGLKLINDTLGHNIGDSAIVEAAGLLKRSIRQEDIVGRLGGDEFVIFSSHITDEGRERVIARIRSAFDRYNRTQNLPYILSCSVGSAMIEDTSEESFLKVLAKADSLLYLEKSEKKRKGLSRI